MKKISIFLILFFLCTTNSFAKKLNYRSNLLMDYPYSYQGNRDILVQLTNNETEKLLYTLDPEKNFDYKTDYEKITNDFLLEEKMQNKIKKYLRLTEEEKDLFTQIKYYMVTQNLIWETIHPEKKILIENEEFKKYQQEMEEKIELVPNWIKDYEITKELTLEKKDHYQLTTKDCEIKETESTWTISNCRSNAKIKVEELGEEQLYFYRVEEKSIGLESGFSPCTWYFNITIKETDEKPDDSSQKEEQVPEESDEQVSEKADEQETVKPEEKEEKPLKEIEENREKYPIYQVPDTKENSFLWPYCIILIILGLIRKTIFS